MLSEKDALILSHLRKDARKKLTEISRETGIPTSTIHERLKGYLKQGLRLVSLPRYPRLHMPIQCWLLIKARNKKAVQSALMESPFVNVLLVVNNGADFAVECVFSTLKQQHETIEDLKRHGRVTLYPVIEEVGRELFDPLTLTSE